MAPARTGGCLCGAIRYESAGEPQFALQCHCRDCQRASGSGYVAAVRMPSSAAAWFSRASPLQRIWTSPILNATVGKISQANRQGNEFLRRPRKGEVKSGDPEFPNKLECTSRNPVYRLEGGEPSSPGSRFRL